jgi:hypothetical protein
MAGAEIAAARFLERGSDDKSKQGGLVVAILLGGRHLLWSVLVAAGWAQPLINWAARRRRLHKYLLAPGAGAFNVGP